MKGRPLIQLLRPPNLFTVPGDPVCGALLASGGVWSWRIVACIGVSLAAYCAGLIINDLADYAEDLRDRPGRPLPSGGVSRGTAKGMAAALGLVAIGLAGVVSKTLAVLAVLLMAEILWYNLMAKRSALLGPIAMGLCRGISVMLGVVAIMGPIKKSVSPAANGGVMIDTIVRVPPALAYAAAAVIALYIAGITVLARNETRSPKIPPMIGKLIRGLLFIQAGFCMAAGHAGWAAAAVLLALWPISGLVAKRFYGS